jgi:hypothetical protein
MELSNITDTLGITNVRSKQPKPADNPSFSQDNLEEKEVLYTWEAPLRPEIKFFQGRLTKNLMIIGAILAVFLLLIGELIIILVIASTLFIGFILANTPSETGTYELSTHGINYAGDFYYWNQLNKFFFTEEGDVTILNVDVKEELPARLFLTLNEGDREKIKELCQKYLPYLEEPPRGFMEKGFNKLTSKLDF